MAERKTIEALLREHRTFPPPEELRAGAHVSSEEIYARAAEDPEGFWAERAAEQFWFRKWDEVLDWDCPWAKWFVGARTNLSVNCLDRHIEAGKGDKVAFHWEGEPGDERTFTYSDVHAEVCRMANALKSLGVTKGDRVTLYMGMIPELPVALLACARIGAAHSVVFGGFSAQSLVERIHDSGSKVVVTADGAWRRGKVVPLKATVDRALAECPEVENVLVVRRVGEAAHVEMRDGRDHWWHELREAASTECPPEEMDAEDLLFLLYTSGTTGKPKGIVHTTAGYMVGTAATAKWVFDLRDDDVYWCTADIGWITGHSYIVYGPMANAATQVIYEGAPDFPDRNRFWQLVEKYGVSIFYTAPTAIRAFMRWGDEGPRSSDLSSLRLLGTVGEPINPEAWMWYHQVIGGGRLPIVDTWWQTETGNIMITPLPGVSTLKPGSALRPFPGIEADVVDEQGVSVAPGEGGYLVLTRPWPAMLRGIHGDPERYRETYWSRFPGKYFTGDGARRDADGDLWLLGRVDDIMLVAGHNISTMEVESALVDHDDVVEAAVVGRPDEVKGQAIAAFVTLREGVEGTPERIREISDHVVGEIGPIARPAQVHWAAELPKTRSGKIMRRLLRDIAEGHALGDTTTLADPAVVDELRQRYEEKEG